MGEKYEKMMVTLGIVLKGDEKSLTGKPLMKRTMQIWINAADTLLSMIVTKLPSPRVAQRYRVENLYEGPMDDEAAKAMRACDKDGPLLMYVSKMVPTSDKGRFYAFCQFIMTPINQLMRAIMDDQKEKYEKMMVTLGIVLKGDEKSLTGKPLMKRTMQIWINA